MLLHNLQKRSLFSIEKIFFKSLKLINGQIKHNIGDNNRPPCRKLNSVNMYCTFFVVELVHLI